jgi:hypothetical protein
MSRATVTLIVSVATFVIVGGIATLYELTKDGVYVPTGEVECVADVIVKSPSHQPKESSVHMQCGDARTIWMTTEPVEQGDKFSCTSEQFVPRIKTRLAAEKTRLRPCKRAVA